MNVSDASYKLVVVNMTQSMNFGPMTLHSLIYSIAVVTTSLLVSRKRTESSILLLIISVSRVLLQAIRGLLQQTCNYLGELYYVLIRDNCFIRMTCNRLRYFGRTGDFALFIELGPLQNFVHHCVRTKTQLFTFKSTSVPILFPYME